MTKKLEGFEFWKVKLKEAKLVVAPMVDQSECAWRMLSRKYGAELCYTPMLHASIFSRDPIYRRDALATCEGDRPLIVQFCANDPEVFLKAAKLAEPHCDAIDLNLGCPQSIAKRGHYGAFLQDEWDLIRNMVNLCHRELKVPITCKIRVYESVEKTVKYAQMLESAGCQLLTVHGRTREQKGRFTGIASWDHIKAVRENVTIPVFANGNIQYLPDVERCLAETGVEGVMTAEGNLHNPALFTGTSPPLWKVAEEYLSLVEKYPCPISYVRAHIFKLFIHALQIHQDIREELGKGKSMDCFKLAVLKLKERCLADVKLFKENPEAFKSHLPLPYWLCQPYIRPSPEEARAKEELAKEREKLKRPLTNLNGEEEPQLSKNKLKKKLKYPNKNFDADRKMKFEKCDTCNNPKGYKCVFSLCKNCCRAKAFAETLDCFGHNIFFKTKKERKRELEEKQKQMALKNEELLEALDCKPELLAVGHSVGALVDSPLSPGRDTGSDSSIQCVAKDTGKNSEKNDPEVCQSQLSVKLGQVVDGVNTDSTCEKT